MPRVLIHSPRDDKRTLLRAQLMLSVDLSRSLSNYYTFQIGLAQGESVDYFGSLSTSDKVLAGSTQHVLTAEDLSERIEDGETIVLDVTRVGTPPSITGSVVEVEVGNILDDPAHRLTDPIQREAADSQLEYLRDTEATTQRYSVTLTDELFGAAPTEEQAIADDAETGTTAYSSTTYASFSPAVSITLTPPDEESTYIAKVWLRFTIVGTAGATIANARIRNTTASSDLDEMTDIAALSTTLDQPYTLFGQEEVTAATTYEAQFNKDAAGATNSVIGQPKIMGWLEKKEA